MPAKPSREAVIQGELTHMEHVRSRENRSFTDAEKERIDALLSERDNIREQRNREVSKIASEVRANPAKFTGLGMSGSDPVFNPDGQRYSLLRAINCRLQGKELDGYEAEVSQEIARRNGTSPNGFYMPLTLPVGNERRDLNTTTGAGAVQSTFLGNRFIDALRNRTVLANLGATILTDLVGDIDIPKQTGTGTAYWVSEATPPTESQAAISQVNLSPSTVGAFTDVTRRLIKQSSLDIELLVRNDLVQALGIELDRVGVNGSGEGVEPEGILQNGDITVVEIGDNGGAPTWAKVVELESTVKTANADRGAMAYLTSNFGRGKLKTTPKAAGYPIFLWESDNTINGYRAESSNQVPSDIEKGEGEDLTALIFGDFSTVFIGLWGAVDINIDPYSLGTHGGVRITALLDCDLQFRNTESLAAIVDMSR